YINPILGVIQIIGLIAFLRGWVQISRATNAGNQPGVVSKALTYIIAGIMAINIKLVICTFNSTLLGAAACA
ncbi:MAG: type IV secretion protein IcmC, partial [Pseudomonadota bacterium]|nr:type IV secretion protein IcmC [Pseudomonadota bacterium]